MVIPVENVDFECYILVTSGCFSGSVFNLDLKQICHDLLKIAGQPYGRSSPKTKFTDHLVFGSEHVADVDRVILSLFEFLKPFLFKHLRRRKSLVTAGWKDNRKGRRFSKHLYDPSDNIGHAGYVEEEEEEASFQVTEKGGMYNEGDAV